MKRALEGLSILIFVTLCVAQAENTNLKDKDIPDLNGTWILDKSKSDTGLDKGPVRFSGRVEFSDTSLSIAHREPEIKVIETRKNRDGSEAVEESIYFTDGKNGSVAGNKNPDVKPTAKWKERKLIIKSSMPVGGLKINGRPARLEKTEVWEISKNGKTLIQTISWESEANLPNPAPMKKVFMRSR